jgi:hypothetical protein
MVESLMPGAELGLGLTIAPTVYSGPLSPPVQLLRQSAPGEIIVSSKVGR